MNTDKVKTANMLYRESGSTLPFSQWISREKEKLNQFRNASGEDLFDMPLMANKPLTDSINRTLEQMRNELPVKQVASPNTVFGIKKTAIIIASVVLIGAITYKVIVKVKSKKASA